MHHGDESYNPEYGPPRPATGAHPHPPTGYAATGPRFVTPRRKSNRTLVIVLVIIGLLCVSASVALALSSVIAAPPKTPQEVWDTEANQSGNTKLPTSAQPVGPRTSFGDGTWMVGVDIQAGTYRSMGAGSECYWSITKAGSNGSDIIDNHIGGGNLTVTLKADQEFTTKRCPDWSKSA